MIRNPAVAGYFYSDDRQILMRAVRSYLRRPEKLCDARAIIAPHAGYIYSGDVAGATYSSVRLPKRFIILGPNHRGYGVPLSLYPSGEWRTPLGLAPIDSDLTGRLKQECPALEEDSLAHSREHSLEVQLPFLQALVPDFRFAAICVGTGEYSSLAELGRALARVLTSLSEPALLISSSDMNHYESAAVSAVKDRLAIEKVLEVDPEGLHRVVREKEISMCGIAPTVAVLAACRDLGSTRGELIRYSHSGDVSGEYDRVVGYAGMIVR